MDPLDVVNRVDEATDLAQIDSDFLQFRRFCFTRRPILDFSFDVFQHGIPRSESSSGSSGRSKNPKSHDHRSSTLFIAGTPDCKPPRRKTPMATVERQGKEFGTRRETDKQDLEFQTLIESS
jgi:hypothetical protein